MSTTFKKCLEHTLKFEGKFNNDPDDPGGATNHGVSLRFLWSLNEITAFDYDSDGDLDADDIRLMSRSQSSHIYKQHFWNELYYELPEALAIKVFDLGVNIGTVQAVELLQGLLNGVTIDGIYGPKTHHAVLCNNVLHDYIAAAAMFYYELAERRSSSRKYLFGWLRRCYA